MGTCTAFLVGPDLVASAGHCFPTSDSCRLTSIAFGVGSYEKSQDSRLLSPNQVYKCKQILVQGENDSPSHSDFALIQLDRAVVGIDPLKFRTTGSADTSASLALIGYPSGLPLKIADHGQQILKSNTSSFLANLDGFGGSSGSPVVDVSTGLVEGLLSGGEEDFVKSGSCWKTRVCKDDGQDCEGETVIRSSEFAPFTAIQ